MIAGHFAVAAAAKAADRAVPLWALMLSTAWLDVVFVPLFAAGVERIESATGATGYGSAVIHADYTHSLVGALVLSALFGGAAALRWGRRTGVVLAAVSFSHWILDLLFHRGDMPILPGAAGGLPSLGFGLWQSPAVAIAIEALLVVAGSYLYWRAASDVAGGGRARSTALATSALVLVAGVGVLALDASGLAG
jgi:membrane-bound metal-dependent hydrolase YbcI (DUF457 family)